MVKSIKKSFRYLLLSLYAIAMLCLGCVMFLYFTTEIFGKYSILIACATMAIFMGGAALLLLNSEGFLRYFILLLSGITLLSIVGAGAFYLTFRIKEPKLTVDYLNSQVTKHDGYKECENGLFRVSESGLLELKVNGSPSQIGVASGALMADYLEYQESVFVDQIMDIIPSSNYLRFLRSMIILFNRKITDHIPTEYKEEIFGISKFCTDKFNDIGTPYERQLNYHAAHDIGHAMQQYMLVGCSSFVLNGGSTKSKEMVVGRNFDFYVGDDFAKNKLIAFVEPQAGYKFASVSWPGMVGVLSGMNEKGITVTLNAAKGDIPTSSSTPISILAREILQYSSNLEEAITIAKRREIFVSESILVASASDKNAIVIEKTPDQMGIYRPDEYPLICTNHYQSNELKDSDHNLFNISSSDSKYRFEIIDELLHKKDNHTIADVASILRNRYGKGGADIGLGNEMTINQSIAHHSVIFKPESSLMWVSTSPWQSGRYVCYNLKSIFDKVDFADEIYDRGHEIDADIQFTTNELPLILEYRQAVNKIKKSIRQNSKLTADYIERFEKINPNNYYTYRLLGDYYRKVERDDNSKIYYKKSLNRQIPQLSERRDIEKLLDL